jgi:hypothetical protein
MPDIFISYAREDSTFVRKLVDALKAKERDIWVDFDDIPFASEWWKEVLEGIEGSASGIFVISTDSIQSQYCSLEISELIKNNKKIVPIVVSRPSEDYVVKLPQMIRDLNWVFFDEEARFDESFMNLITALDTDLELAKEHTRLLIRANEWEKRGHNRSLLARGEELASFLPFLEKGNLAAVQREFIDASLVQAEVQQRVWRFICGFLGGLLGMAYFTITTFNGNVSPFTVLLSIAIGEVFGIFTGIIAVFANDIPVTFQKFIPPAFRLPLQIVVCLLAGMLPWILYKGIFLNYVLVFHPMTLIGAIGLSLGFIIHALFKPHVMISFIITALSLFLTILIFNDHASTLRDFGFDEPLIYFGNAEQVYWVGLPLALLFALGANGQNLYQWLFGADELTEYFNRRTGIFAWTDEAKDE